MATDVLASEQRIQHNHKLLLQQFEQYAAEQQRQALSALDDEADEQFIAAIQQQVALQHGKLSQRLNDIKQAKLLAAPQHPPHQPAPASPIAPHSASSPTPDLYLSQQILQLLDAATQLLGDKQTAINTLVNLIAQQTPNTAILHPPPPLTTNTLQPPVMKHGQLLTIDLWRAREIRDIGASPAESPSSTRAQLSSTRVSTAPSSPSPVASPLDSPVRSPASPSLSPAASPAFIHPSLLASPMYRPAERPLPPSPHPPSPDRPVNVRVRKSFSYAASPLQSPEPMAEAKRLIVMQSPLTVERLEEQDRTERQEAAERREKLRDEYEEQQAAERRVEWKSNLISELDRTSTEPTEPTEPSGAAVQPIDVILSRSALSSSTTSVTQRRQLRPSAGSTAASTARSTKPKRSTSSSLKSTSSSSVRAANTFAVPAAYAHRGTHSVHPSLSASLTERKQQHRQQREQAAIAASQHSMTRAYDIQASVKSASMKRREEEDERRRRLEAERDRAQEAERRRAHAAHVRRMRLEEEAKRLRREEQDRQREAMSASVRTRERQRLREERRQREQQDEQAEEVEEQHFRSSRSFDGPRLERLLRDASMTRTESRGRREAALRELAERSMHEGEAEREKRRRAVFDEEWTERMLREMMEEYQLDPGRALHTR